MNKKYYNIAIERGNVPKKNMNIIPYLNTLGSDEQIEFLDKLITSALKMGHDLETTQTSYNLFDESILENLNLHWSLLTEKFWLPLQNAHGGDIPHSSLETKSICIEIVRTLAEFAMEKIGMIYALPIQKGCKLPYHRSFCKKSQQKLLGYIARAWAEESDIDKSKQYMNTLISSAVNEYGDMPQTAIREDNRNSIATEEKIVQAIKTCCDVLKGGTINSAQYTQLNMLIQALAIGWIKSLKNPDDVLVYIQVLGILSKNGTKIE
jgi:hypothetical protein